MNGIANISPSFDVDDFLLALASVAKARGLSIAWCAEYGMPEVAAKMVADIGGLFEFRQALQRRAARECELLNGLRRAA